MEKKYKVAMLDIDGVLNEHGDVIMDSARSAIELLKKHGIRVCYASGKHAWYIQGALVMSGLLEDDTIIIGENGGTVFECKTRRLKREGTHYKDIKQLREQYLHEMELKDGYAYFAGMRVWEEPKQDVFCLFPMDTRRIAELDEYLKNMIEKLNLELYTVAHPDAVDVLQAGVDKSVGIASALEWMDGVEFEHVIAVGDALNDLEMLEAAGFAITPDNGYDKTKEIVRNKKENGYIAKQRAGDGFLEALYIMISKGII